MASVFYEVSDAGYGSDVWYFFCKCMHGADQIKISKSYNCFGRDSSIFTGFS